MSKNLIPPVTEEDAGATFDGDMTVTTGSPKPRRTWH